MGDEGQRRLVLTEEDYTSKLSSIVTRDFFPDVPKLERQNELLDCRLKGDVAGAIAVRRATRRSIQDEELASIQRHQDDNDIVEPEDRSAAKSSRSIVVSKTSFGRPIRKRPRPLEEETITGFVARATNEDDNNFDSNLKRDLKENKQLINEIYKSDKNSSTNESTNNSRNIYLEMASDDFAPEPSRIKCDKPGLKNSLFFSPQPISNASRENQEAKTQGLIKASTSTDERSLMPPPTKKQTSGILQIHHEEKKNKNKSHIAKSKLVEYIPKQSLEKKIQPSATRFPSEDRLFPIGNNSNGIINEEFDSDSEAGYASSTTGASTDLDAPLKPVEEERYRFQSKQKSEPYRFVRMSPMIFREAGTQSQITSSGSIDDPPKVLSAVDKHLDRNAPSPFHISAKSERERAAAKAESMLAKRRSKMASSSSRSSSSKRRRKGSTVGTKRPHSLTPAAMSLLKKTKPTRHRSGGAFVSELRSSYTPRRNASSSSSSRRSSKSSKIRMGEHVYNATPQT